MIIATTRIAIHTKSCTEVLGLPLGISAIVRAGITDIVLWAGEDFAYTDEFAEHGCEAVHILGAAFPKMRLREEALVESLERRVTAARKVGAAAAAVILGDTQDCPPQLENWRAFFHFLDRTTLPVVIENNGRREECLSDLATVRWLVQTVGRGRAVLDLGHLAASGRTGTLPRDLTAWVELSDNDGATDSHLPLGKGSGRGRFAPNLRALGWRPELIVIETNEPAASSVQDWTDAIRRDVCELKSLLEDLSW